jgi:hypothetical protein
MRPADSTAPQHRSSSTKATIQIDSMIERQKNVQKNAAHLQAAFSAIC